MVTYTVKQLAAMLQISAAAVRSACKDGGLAHLRIGGRREIRVTAEALAA